MMGSETRYWCDRCGATVAMLEHVEVKRENAEDARPTWRFLDLCAQCCGEFMADVEAFMAKGEVV